MPGFLSGKFGRVRIGAGPTTLRVNSWRVVPRVDKLDVTNSESAGIGEYIAGIKDLDVTLQCDYYYGSNVFGTLAPGDTVSTIKLYLNATTTGLSGSYWDIPSMLVTDLPNESQVRGKVTLTINGAGMGAFVAPTGES